MDDARWDAPRPETLGDADLVSFAPPGRRLIRRGPAWLLPVVTFAVGLGAGSGVAYAVTAGPPPAARQPVPTTTTVNHEVIVPAQLKVGPFQASPPPANPKAGYRAWCDAVSTPHQRITPGRFVARVVLSNTGNVGMSYLVTGVWRVSPDVEVRRSSTRPVAPGTTSRVEIVVPVTAAEVSENRSLAAAHRCFVEVALQSTYTDAFTR